MIPHWRIRWVLFRLFGFVRTDPFHPVPKAERNVMVKAIHEAMSDVRAGRRASATVEVPDGQACRNIRQEGSNG